MKMLNLEVWVRALMAQVLSRETGIWALPCERVTGGASQGDTLVFLSAHPSFKALLRGRAADTAREEWVLTAAVCEGSWKVEARL